MRIFKQFPLSKGVKKASKLSFVNHKHQRTDNHFKYSIEPFNKDTELKEKMNVVREF